jgi:hypothetical protein
VCILVIYFPSCCSLPILSQWYHSNLLFVVSLCMSLMRLGYWELGLELVNIEEEHSYWSKRPHMTEEKRGNKEGDLIKLLLEEALMRKRN